MKSQARLSEFNEPRTPRPTHPDASCLFGCSGMVKRADPAAVVRSGL